MPEGMSYPFLTKAEIRARVATDRAYALHCIGIMQARHEARLAGKGGDGPCGWMSSQSVTALKLATRIAAGEATDEEVELMVATVGRYAKQLAAHFRAVELERNPGLAEAASRFGVGPSGTEQASNAGARRVQAEPTVRSKGAPAPPERPDQRGAAGAALAGAAPAGPGGPPAASPAPSGTHPAIPCHACRRVLRRLSESPGSGSAGVATALGIETAEASKHLRDLLDDKRVRKAGVGRGTKYFVR
jgi:hypothetical protein